MFVLRMPLLKGGVGGTLTLPVTVASDSQPRNSVLGVGFQFLSALPLPGSLCSP